jgi:hypothetical protein
MNPEIEENGVGELPVGKGYEDVFPEIRDEDWLDWYD